MVDLRIRIQDEKGLPMLVNEVIIVLLPDCLRVRVVDLKGKDPTALDVVDFRAIYCVVVL